MTLGAWLTLMLAAHAQDDGNVGQVGQALTGPATLVDVATQRSLGLVNVAGDCSGTLINRYWVLTAHHCVSVKNELWAAPDMPSNVPITAAWSSGVVVRPTKIVTFALSDSLDVALLYLGDGDFGPADTQLFYTQELTTSDTLDKYGQGRSTFAMAPSTPAVSDHRYRTTRLQPSSASSTSYRFTFATGDATGHGGDSGGPSHVMSGNVSLGIAGIQSTCEASGYVTGEDKIWDWATGILWCDDAALYSIRDKIIAASSEAPSDRDIDLDPLPNLSLSQAAPNPSPIWLYDITTAGTLQWSHQSSVSSGWDGPSEVGSGWSGFVDVVPVGGSHLLAVGGDGTLYGYRHDGYLYGSGEWTGGTLLRSDWTYPVTVGGGDGVVYAIDYDGTLLWYRCNDLDRAEDPAVWSGPSAVGWGWGQFDAVVSTGNGTLYARLPSGDLWVYHHDGFTSGAYAWSGIRKVGSGWDMFEHLVGLDNDALIGVEPDGTVSWYHHLGRSGGTGTSFEREVWEGPVTLGGGWAGLTGVFALLGAD